MAVWLVVNVNEKAEELACHWIESAGFEVYWPKFRDHYGDVISLFHRYLFVKYNSSWRKILRTPGVRTIWLKDGGVSPVYIRGLVIDTLRAKQDRLGFVVLPFTPREASGKKPRYREITIHNCFGLYQGMRASGREKVLYNISCKFSVEEP